MIKRTLIAIPAMALLVSVVYFHGLYAKIVLALVAVLCVHEMLGVVRAGAAQPIRPIAYGFAGLLFPAYHFCGGVIGISVLFMLAAISVCVVLVVSGRDAADGAVTVMPMIYPGLFFAALIAIASLPDKGASQFLLIIAFGSAIVTDSLAYFSGMLFGRHKLIPAISPKKTVEGAIGGTIFGTCAVFLLGVFAQQTFGVAIRPYMYLVLGFVLSVLTQIGDLTASIVKRKFGVKDYGRIMGDHGGAMDRLDSVMFISPVVFAFYFLMTA